MVFVVLHLIISKIIRNYTCILYVYSVQLVGFVND